MRSTVTYRFLCITLLLCAANHFAAGQITMPPLPAGADTIRLIEILQGQSLREKLVDTVPYKTIAGQVQLKESLTLFNCDSAAINEITNVMEAFGNIHINQQDSIHTYAQYLKYIGQERMAYLKKDVRLMDKKGGTLFTQELEYDLKSNIGKYKNGGRVVNGKTTLTSEEGVYYADSKDVYFKKNVHLTDPKYDIRTDSMLYNTQTQVVTFITQTHIKSKDGGDVYTKSGTYDLKNGKAFFGFRTIFKDSTTTYVADRSAIDEASGTAQLEGNAIVRDSVNGYTVLGGQIFFNKNNKSFLATRKPVLIFKGDGNDSTYIAADTLYSGIIVKGKDGVNRLVNTDTLRTTTVIENEHDKINIEKLYYYHSKDSSSDTTGTNIILPEKTIEPAVLKNDSIPATAASPKDSAATAEDIPSVDTATLQPANLKRDTSINTSSDTAIRYFQAFHHVRIFNDSIQAVCDSLLYSSEDSVFRLFNDPLVFSNKSQISGDTIHLYTKNKKAERVYVFDNGIMINEENSQMYNQIGGRTLNGYFKDGVLDYMRVKGSPAESIFYPKDEDSAYTGMNRCKGDVIDIYFVDKAVNKVKFINDVEGILYPVKQIPEDQKHLTKFKWQDARRPKNKLELFE